MYKFNYNPTKPMNPNFHPFGQPGELHDGLFARHVPPRWRYPFLVAFWCFGAVHLLHQFMYPDPSMSKDFKKCFGILLTINKFRIHTKKCLRGEHN